MSRACLMAGMCLLLVGVILDIISVASDEWTTFRSGETNGLWRTCPVSGSCVKIASTDDLEAIRAMMLLSVVISGISMVIAIIELAYGAAREKTSRWITRFVCSFTFLAAIFTLIGIVVYAANVYDEFVSTVEPEYGYSYWLGVVALILFVVAAIFFLASTILRAQARRRREKEEKQRIYQREYQYGIFTKNPRLRGAESINKYPTRHSGRTNQSFSGRSPPALYPYGAYPGYFVPAPRPFNIYNHGDTSVLGPAARAGSASGYPASASRRSDYNGDVQRPASVYAQSTKSYLGNNISKQEPVYARANKSYLGNAANQQANLYARSTKNYLEVPGNARGGGNNNLGSSVYSTANDYRYGMSRGSSKVGRDEYGYPLNYQRDL